MKTRLSWWVGLIGFLIVLATPIFIGLSLQPQAPEPTRFEREQAAWISQVAAHAENEAAKNPEVLATAGAGSLKAHDIATPVQTTMSDEAYEAAQQMRAEWNQKLLNDRVEALERIQQDIEWKGYLRNGSNWRIIEE